MKTLKVGSTTKTLTLAHAISCELGAHGAVAVQAIGPDAVNQGVKAVILARGMISVKGQDLTMTPRFTDIPLGEDFRIGVVLEIRLWKSGENHEAMAEWAS
jgi:stage V sporulation protein SpoVS